MFTPLNLIQSNDQFIASSILSGYDKSAIRIECDESTLYVSAGGVRRKVKLPMPIDTDNIEATHIDGILRITLSIKNPLKIIHIS